MDTILTSNRALVFLILFFLFLIAVGIRTRYFHPLSSFPGPFLASISPLYSIWASRTCNEHEILARLHQKYGPIVRYQPNMLLFAEAAMVPVIYNRYADKTEFNRLILPGEVPNVVGLIGHKEHSDYRKRIAGMYSMSAAKQVESMVDVRIMEFKSRVGEKFVGVGRKLDFARWTQYFAYDVISEIAFGKPLGFMASNSDVHNLIASAHKGLWMLNTLARSDWFKKAARYPFVINYLIPAMDKETGIGRLIEERNQILTDRINEQSNGLRTGKRVDLMQHLLDTKNTAAPLTLNQVKAELLVIMVAGSDTTAATLRGILLNLLRTPDCYQTLISEIDAYTATHPPFSVISYDDAAALPYLTACIKESMRFSPATPSILPRHPNKGGLTLSDGRYIPESAKMSVNSHVCQRDPKLYGEDADVYNPQRWLGGGNKVREMERHDIHFGAGSRTCLGKNIAYLELWKMTFEFFRTYKPTIVEPEKIEIKNIGLLVHKNLYLQLEERA
ncbi:cytochrome P450 [Morchella snyderi]|nr:cytochrome P450 [Morchella snyderi]